MALDLAGMIAARLCFAVPLIYIGLSMAMDPREFVISLDRLSFAVHALVSRFRGTEWQLAIREPVPAHASLIVQRAVRLTGSVLVVCAFLSIAALVP